METEIPTLPQSTWEGFEALLTALTKRKIDNTKKVGLVFWCGKGFAKSFLKKTKRKGYKRNPYKLKEYTKFYL